MKITFDTWNQNPGVDKTTTSQSASTIAAGQQAGAYALDISGTVMDNNAYVDHGRSTKDVMQSFDAQMDISVQRDYMTVMSNILSTEDFNKMMEDGFDPSKLEPEQVVTIVDHIKATMAQSGQVIQGYNDDLDEAKLKEIVGDAGLAKEIEQALKDGNLPVNEENVASLMDSLEKASSVSKFDDASKKYMVENRLEPTVENLYRAKFSALGDGSKQSRGYYAQEMPGYFAKKADDVDWSAMQPQLEKAIGNMNLNHKSPEESLKQAKWLVEKGIPVTEDSMRVLGEIDSVTFPLNPTTVMQASVCAVLEGKSASEGNVVGSLENIYEKAIRYEKEAKAITQEAVKETVDSGKEITLQNLYEEQKKIEQEQDREENRTKQITGAEVKFLSENSGFVEEKYITAARQLAEVQLCMTIDANMKLLKSDYAIDTAPLSELVENLKQQEQQLAAQFLGSENPEGISEKAQMFTQTRSVLQELPFLPVDVIGRITYENSVTLEAVHTQGIALRGQYEAAEASYEALMTAPRADMGDSIKKAFRNVDDILQDMEMDLSEDNRKAVRILGYNRMEITQDAIRDVKDTHLQVEDVIKSMTPQRTLALIREGVNPLTMELEELEQYLNQLDHTPEEEMTKYSRYLYELEKNGQINESEREAYIGVYRLFHQIEKSDGAAIGSLMAQGAELTLGNLLTAVRNRKAGNMDYAIDDSFGTLQGTVEKGKSISGQIEKGVREARVARSIYRDLSVEGLQQIPLTEQTTLEELREGLSSGNQEFSSEEMEKEMFAGFRQNQSQASEAEESVWNLMKQQDIDFTMENLVALNAILTDKGQLVRRIKDIASKLDEQGITGDREAKLKLAGEEIVENFSDYESAQKTMENWETLAGETIQEAVNELPYTSNDIRNLYGNYKQISVMSSLKKRESYEVPMEINGETTSIHLTLVRDAEETGTVSITMDTKTFGKAGAKFRVSENRIESYFISDSEMGKEHLQAAGESILDILRESGMEIGDTHFINARAQGRKEWNPLTFSERNVDNNNRTVATKQLYNIAGIFLKGMQKYT